MEVTNNLLAFLVIIAMVVTITGTLSMLSLMPGVELPITGMAQGTAAGTANVTLLAELAIKLIYPYHVVDFGDIAAVPGTEETTMYFSPHPFVLENNGSVVINVSIAEANATGDGLLWNFDDNGTYFEYNCTKNASSTTAVWYAPWTAFNDAHEVGSFAAENLNIDASIANLVYNLSTGQTFNQVDVHINVTVPSEGEPSGQKTATILFNAEMG